MMSSSASSASSASLSSTSARRSVNVDAAIDQLINAVRGIWTRLGPVPATGDGEQPATAPSPTTTNAQHRHYFAGLSEALDSLVEIFPSRQTEVVDTGSGSGRGRSGECDDGNAAVCLRRHDAVARLQRRLEVRLDVVNQSHNLCARCLLYTSPSPRDRG